MTEPTDAELVAVMRDGYNCRYNDEQKHIDFARAVLAKWGAPQPVVQEPLTDEEIADFVGEQYHNMTYSELKWFRLGEAAHGITQKGGSNDL